AAGEAGGAKLEAPEDVDGVLLDGARVDGGLQHSSPDAVVAVPELDVRSAGGRRAAECAVGAAFVGARGAEIPAPSAWQLAHLVPRVVKTRGTRGTAGQTRAIAADDEVAEVSGRVVGCVEVALAW